MKFSRFISDDKKFIVHLPKKCIDDALRYIKKADKFETGGIIVGNYSGDHITANIETLCSPPCDSESGRTWFARGTKGVKKTLQKLWKKQIYYLGEWHFHPQGSPTPSGQDKRQLKEMAELKTLNCPEPIMMIIGGNYKKYEIGFFIMTRSLKFYELTEIEN